MEDLLIDVNVAIDVCAHRSPHAEWSAAALLHCTDHGGRLWLYSGSVQTLEYTLLRELKRQEAEGQDPAPSNAGHQSRARALLQAFTADKNWLAALAGEGPVFDSPDPEDEQLLRALGRFPEGTIRLLTRDERLLAAHPDRAVSPRSYCEQEAPEPDLDFIDLQAQQDAIRPALEQRIHQILRHGKYIMGPEIGELEERLADYVGVKHAIGVASGTDALLIALMALEVGQGDEVITTPFSFIATAEVIALLGAKPVFVDIDPDTYNIDATQIEAAITDRTRAIMPVSLYGQPADFDEINTIADKHGLPVIEDGAQSFGATYKAKKSCGLTTIGCTSFFPSKPLGGYGDSGACFTDDDELAKRMREIRVHGQDRRYHHPILGVNGRMDTLQAAILLPKLESFPEEVRLRQVVAGRYQELLATELHGRALKTEQENSHDLPCDSVADKVVLPWVAPDRTSVYAQYTIQVPDREAVQAALKETGVPTAVHYPVPLYRQPAFAHLETDPADFPNCEAASERVVSLPMHPHLQESETGKVVQAMQCAVEAREVS